MFRGTADTKTYITGMLKRVVRKCNITEDKFEIKNPLLSKFDYLILRNNIIIVKDRYDQVEEHRQRSAFSYENWLEKQINRN